MTGNMDVKVYTTSQKGMNSAYFTVYAHDGKTVLATNVQLWWSQANNITMYLRTADGYIIMNAKTPKGSTTKCVLDAKSEEAILKEIAKAAILNSVSDVMGDYIVFDEVVSGDFSNDNPPTYQNSTKTLTWIPSIKKFPYVTLPGENRAATDTFKFEALDVGGRYSLTELEAPEGYNRLLSPVYFTVQSDGLVFTDENGQPLAAPPEYVSDTSTSDKIALTVKNEPGYELPSTGGPGTTIYTLSGALVLIAALLYSFGSRRRQKRRFE